MALLASCASRTESAAPAGDPAAGGAKAKSQDVVGIWAYAQSCGWQHSADLDIARVTGGGFGGRWSDGHRAGGQSGELRGELRDGKLYLRFCRDDLAAGQAGACPDFGAESAYAVRNGERLEWFRSDGAEGYRHYLSMHPVVEGKAVPVDDRCAEQH